MFRNKRTSSCPNFNSKSNFKLKEGVSKNKKILEEIQRCLPTLLGQTIKLCDLFVSVVSRGGYKKVCELRLWPDVARELSIPSDCANISIGLRRIYYQYLVSIEKKEYPEFSESFILPILSDTDGPSANSQFHATVVEQNLGIGHSTVGNQMHFTTELLERSTRSTRNLFMSYHDYQGHTTGDRSDFLLRQNKSSLTSTFVDPSNERISSELRLVELALASGLPNEIEVALNSLLVLSITPLPGSSSIRLVHCLNLLSLLLASVGIYGDGLDSYLICDDSWEKQNQLNFLKFWYNIVRDPMGRSFIRSDVFINSDLTEDEYDSLETKNMHELFAPMPYRKCSTNHIVEDLETSRVLLIATILINLVTPPPVNHPAASNGHSAIDDDDAFDFGPSTYRCLYPSSVPLGAWLENARYVAAQPSALRFFFLCASSEHSGLRSLGLQLLSSIRYPLDPPMCPLPVDNPPIGWTPLIGNGCRLGQLTLAFITRCLLESEDRTDLVAGLSFLANLANVPDWANAPSLLDKLSSSIWPRLVQLICLPDLAIVCASLEALRCLTSLGTAMCLICWRSCLVNETDFAPLNLLQPLLALLTLEGQSMGSQSLHRIRLMQRNAHHPIPSNVQHPNVQFRGPPNINPSQKSIRPREPHRNVRLHPRLVQPLQGQAKYHPDQMRPEFSTLRPIQPPQHSLQPIVNRLAVPPSNYRPPNVNSSLIHLLSSSPIQQHQQPPPPTFQLSSTPSNSAIQSTTASSPTSPLKSNTSSNGCMLPTLSELTDRLQMPPPSLPPPSALRRSAKWSQQPRSKSKLSPGKSDQGTTGCSSGLVNDVKDVLVSSQNDNELSPKLDDDTSVECVNSDKLAKHPSQEHDVSSTTTIHCDSKDDVDGRRDSPSSNEVLSNQPVSLMNGIVDNEEHDRKLPNSCHVEDGGHATTLMNGLKPGLLQAAVKVIHNQRLEQELNVKKSMVNGLATDCENGDDGAIMTRIEDKCKNNNHGYSTKDQRLEDSTVHETKLGKEEKERSSFSDADASAPNNNNNNNDNVVRMNGHMDVDEIGHKIVKQNYLVNGDGDKVVSRLSLASTSSSRLLKRRRKWGSCNRMFTPKRRRDYLNNMNVWKLKMKSKLSRSLNDNNIVTSTSCEDTVTTSSNTVTDVKYDHVPGSVLGSSWQPNEVSDASETKDDGKSAVADNVDGDSQPSGAGSDSTTTSDAAESGSCENPTLYYLCEWDCCTASFQFKQQVTSHVYNDHLLAIKSHKSDDEIQKPLRCGCRWRGCQSASIARAPFALMTHVLDMHCSSRELELKKSTMPSDEFPSCPDVSYSSAAAVEDQSAWSIIRSVEARNYQAHLCTAHHHFLASNPLYPPSWSPINPSFHLNMIPPPREGPVTKHLRVTAALVLRNLVTYLKEARIWLVGESQLLSEITMGCCPTESGLRTNDASSIIAQCLALCASIDQSTYDQYRSTNSDCISSQMETIPQTVDLDS